MQRLCKAKIMIIWVMCMKMFFSWGELTQNFEGFSFWKYNAFNNDSCQLYLLVSWNFLNFIKGSNPRNRNRIFFIIHFFATTNYFAAKIIFFFHSSEQLIYRFFGNPIDCENILCVIFDTKLHSHDINSNWHRELSQKYNN